MLAEGLIDLISRPAGWLFSKIYFPAHEFLPYSSDPDPSGNPDPHDYKVLDSTVYNDLRSDRASTIVTVRYPNCSNYNGLKLLVYDFEMDTEYVEKLDPHFLENKNAPFARFEPTEKGYAQAEKLAINLIRDEG